MPSFFRFDHFSKTRAEMFFGRFQDTKISFWNSLTFNLERLCIYSLKYYIRYYAITTKERKSKRSRPKLRYSKWLFESDHQDKSVGLRDLRTLSRQLDLSWSSPKSKWYISINFALDWIPWSPKKSVPSKWRRLLSATKNQKIQGRSITKENK